MPEQQKTLKDYERECWDAVDPADKRRIALEARDSLIQTPVPETIKTQIERQLNQESTSSGEAAPLPTGELKMDDALCAQLEARLADFLPSIFYLKAGSADELLTRARAICDAVDKHRENNYWTRLFDFLKNSAAAQWRQWRIAAIAQQNARTEIGNGAFERAKWFAGYGLKNLIDISESSTQIRDDRLYLDLCSRLENTIAEGDACLNVAFELGKWIIEESGNIKHHLRVVGMRHNLGNQYLIAGKNNEAIPVLEAAQQTCNACWPIRDMSYFQVNLLERLTRAYLNRGKIDDIEKATDNLEKFGIYARRAREKTLYHLQKGYLAIHAAANQGAEQEFHTALEYAQGRESSDAQSDFFNCWSVFASLALLCLINKLPNRALDYLEEARKHGEKLLEFLNGDRKIHDFLVLAEAYVQNDNRGLAQEALNKAENLSKDIDSPRRQIQLLFIKSLLYDGPNAPEDINSYWRQAIAKARENGFNDPDEKMVKIAVFS